METTVLEKSGSCVVSAMAFWAAAALSLGYSGCDVSLHSQMATASSESKQPVTVNAIALKRVEHTIETATYFGTLQPNRRAYLGFGIGGEIEQMASVGDFFAPGQRIASLKNGELTQRKSAIEQNLLAAKAVAQDTPRTAQQETQIASLEAERAAIDSEISKTQIVAPFECVVAELLATQGGLTEGRKAAIKIVEVARPNVEIDLPRRIAQWINSQQSYSFLINGSVKQGTLLRRSVTENPVGNSTFWFELQQAEGMDALFGSTVECRFNLRTDATGFWVPLSALSHRGKGIWSVMVLAEGQGDSAVGLNEVQRRLVEVKQVEEQRALIDGGVASGDLVIAAGLHRVVAGQKVKMNLIQARTTVASKPGSEP